MRWVAMARGCRQLIRHDTIVSRLQNFGRQGRGLELKRAHPSGARYDPNSVWILSI